MPLSFHLTNAGRFNLHVIFAGDTNQDYGSHRLC